MTATTPATTSRSNAPDPWSPDAVIHAVRAPRTLAHLVRHPQHGGVGVLLGEHALPTGAEVIGVLPPLFPEDLGGHAFSDAHGCRFAYVVGAMANGIATPALVIAAARAGCLGFFGAAGLDAARIEAGVDTIAAALAASGLPWGSNLIHSPQEPQLERETAALYIRKGVRRVSASAFMNLQPSVVHYAATGLQRLDNGMIVRRHHLFAKISRPEVARHFLLPAPERMLQQLVAEGALTAEEAELAGQVSVASDIIIESDSGGHTDNRPLAALLPTIQRLQRDIGASFPAALRARLGAAGGIGTPQAVVSAFSQGAAFVLTGSVNQAATESGLAAEGRRMLAAADLADVMMCAAADMFELGVKLQVLRRGTMFGARANRLHETWANHDSWDAVPATRRGEIEARIFGAPFEQVWQQTAAFWQQRQPSELERAAADPRHKMALCFRWYLGKSSRWAIAGDLSRRADWQIWCGPAMGAFNQWVKGSFLEAPEQRACQQIALNLLEGATCHSRALQLRLAGAHVPEAAWHFTPRPLS